MFKNKKKSLTSKEQAKSYLAKVIAAFKRARLLFFFLAVIYSFCNLIFFLFPPTTPFLVALAATCFIMGSLLYIPTTLAYLILCNGGKPNIVFLIFAACLLLIVGVATVSLYLFLPGLSPIVFASAVAIGIVAPIIAALSLWIAYEGISLIVKIKKTIESDSQKLTVAVNDNNKHKKPLSEIVQQIRGFVKRLEPTRSSWINIVNSALNFLIQYSDKIFNWMQNRFDNVRKREKDLAKSTKGKVSQYFEKINKKYDGIKGQAEKYIFKRNTNLNQMVDMIFDRYNELQKLKKYYQTEILNKEYKKCAFKIEKYQLLLLRYAKKAIPQLEEAVREQKQGQVDGLVNNYQLLQAKLSQDQSKLIKKWHDLLSNDSASNGSKIQDKKEGSQALFSTFFICFAGVRKEFKESKSKLQQETNEKPSEHF